MIEYNIEQGIRLTRTSHLSFQFTRLCDWSDHSPLPWRRQNQSCKTKVALLSWSSGTTGMPKWVQWFDKYRSTYIAISGTRVLQYRITGQSPKLYTGNSALQDRKQVQFFWIPFRPGDQSIFGLASFNFNSDPTCYMFSCVRFTGAN